MKTNPLTWTFLLLLTVALNLCAQHSEADRKLLADIRAKAEIGDAECQWQLGFAFGSGCLGVERDEAEAVKWYRKAVEQNFVRAQFNLGVCYERGLGVATDYVEAAKWYRKAAEQNFALAQYNLGICYANGKGVVKDEEEAVKWFGKSVEQNIAAAQFCIGVCYERGQGVAKDDVEAAKWYRKAAEQNYAAAQYNLGHCYAIGQGLVKDEVEAMKWLRKAAEQNYATAQYLLGVGYANGQGVVADEVEALKWWRKAVEQNLAAAQFSIGVCYDRGQGIAKDDMEAVKWFRKAAEQNYASAQYNLGVSYGKGQGVPKNYVEAYKWWLLAAGQGDQAAKKAVIGAESLLSQEQIAEGQELAHDFRPRKAPESGTSVSLGGIVASRPAASGTGFFITADGYLVSNCHVVKDVAKVRLVTDAGFLDATVVKVDAANDLALLKAVGAFKPLPIAASRTVKLGGTVATVGFPDIGLQGFAPKLAKGEIASLLAFEAGGGT